MLKPMTTPTHQPLSFTSLRSKALAMLTRREHSQFELKTKLAELGADSTQIETIVSELAAQAWQDDRRFSEVLIRSYVRKGQGTLNIRQELKQRGINDKDLIEELLAEYDWFALAQQTRCKNLAKNCPQNAKSKLNNVAFCNIAALAVSNVGMR